MVVVFILFRKKMGGRFYNNKEELSPALKMCQTRGCLNENVSKRALFPPTKLITLIFFNQF